MITTLIRLLAMFGALPKWIIPLLPIIEKDGPLVETIITDIIAVINASNGKASQTDVLNVVKKVIQNVQDIPPSEIPAYASDGSVVSLGLKRGQSL